VFQEVVHLNLPNVRKRRREGREHLVWYVLDTERFLDVLHRNESDDEWDSRVKVEKTHLICTVFQLQKTEFFITACKRCSCKAIWETYCQPDDRQPWQSMVVAGPGDFVAIS